MFLKAFLDKKKIIYVDKFLASIKERKIFFQPKL
jgi:hypothetical protein